MRNLTYRANKVQAIIDYTGLYWRGVQLYGLNLQATTTSDKTLKQINEITSWLAREIKALRPDADVRLESGMTRAESAMLEARQTEAAHKAKCPQE